MINKDKIKTWFVTGASSGVGFELCNQLLSRGYNVVAVSRHPPESNYLGNNIIWVSTDVTSTESISNAFKVGVDRFGKIDVLFNNAGISANVLIELESSEHMLEVMKVNWLGVFNTMNLFIPYFRARKFGTIINNSSQSGLTPRLYGAAYCSSKHAIEGLSDVARIETQKFCRVMTVNLGYFKNTNIYKNSQNKILTISAYNTLDTRYPNTNYNKLKNNLSYAVSCIINETEKEKMNERLILGSDAYFKIFQKIKYLKNDLYLSRKRALECSTYNSSFKKEHLKKFFSIERFENYKVLKFFCLKIKFKQ